ncbi:MAG: hypothetical protein K0S33_4266 [Bacteroidetes bacterium]|nr:hypothetical protein [Bacteroidota bacterium]
MYKIKKLRSLSIIFLLFPLLTKAFVNSPQVNCVSVSGGDVTLNWTAPADPSSEFVSYNIFVSNSLNGTYSPVITIPTLATTSYTYVGAGANTTPKFFYITTTSSDGSTQPATDTVRTIFLVVTNPLNGGVGFLQWNPVSDPLHPSSGVSYTIYREYPAGVYSVLGTTTNTKWRDTISICSFAFNYYVEISDANGCNSTSNVVNITIEDKTDPVPPGLDSVSIDPFTGDTIMGISASPSQDVVAFQTYQYVGVSYANYHVLTGNFSHTDTIRGGSGTYSVASMDSCGNLSIILPNQRTIGLQYNYSLCGRSVTLGWTPYINMRNGVRTYRIFQSVNGGAYTMIDDTAGLSYTVENLQQNKTYKFFVRAVDSTGTITSSSNVITFFSKSQPLPVFIYVKSVSVNLAQDIDIGIQVDDTSGVQGIEVYRSRSATGTFTLVGYITCAPGNASYYITDANVETATTEYYYKAIAIDSCGLPAITSNVSKSVVLQVVSNADRTNTLSWTDYESYLGNVAAWNIYRSVDDVFDPVPVATVPGGIFTYIDDVEAFIPNAGRFNYYVQAVEGTGNPYGLMELSNSNIAETYHSDNIFIPSAFVPKGLNKVFLPMTQYVEKTEYMVSIYDRWGGKIWETQSDSEGWDGGGHEGGWYVYVIEYKNAFGEYKRINGNVLMIK